MLKNAARRVHNPNPNLNANLNPNPSLTLNPNPNPNHEACYPRGLRPALPLNLHAVSPAFGPFWHFLFLTHVQATTTTTTIGVGTTVPTNKYFFS